jgi:hypothetical protein
MQRDKKRVYLGGAHPTLLVSISEPTNDLPRHVTFKISTPLLVSFHIMPSKRMLVPGSHAPKSCVSVHTPTERCIFALSINSSDILLLLLLIVFVVVVVVLEGISSSMPISFSSLYSSFELSAELLSPQFVSVTLFKLFVGVGVFEPLLFSNNRDDEDVDVEHEAELFRLFRLLLLLFVMFKVESSSLNFSN